MSGILAKLNLTNAHILTPDEAFAALASKGEWSTLAQRVSQYLRSQNNGTLLALSGVKFSDIGLSPDDFKRTKATKNAKVGDIDYSGIRNAAAAFGLKVRPTVDEFQMFYVPNDPDALIAKTKETRKKSAANTAAKKKTAAVK